jgi:hypothetical protein
VSARPCLPEVLRLATYHAITAIGTAVLKLLEEASKSSPFAGIGFGLFLAEHFQRRPFTEEGISLYLYRTTVSTAQRRVAPRQVAPGVRTLPALPLDLYYLLTPWAKTAERQHLLLGWSMRVLADTPSLNASLLNKHSPNPSTFWPDETVELVPDVLSIQDMLNVWEVGKPNLQISAAYIARVVPIESHVTETLGPPVQARLLDMGKKEG